jgi:hypothetical protein
MVAALALFHRTLRQAALTLSAFLTVDSPSVTFHHSRVTASFRSRERTPYRPGEQQRLAPD